jgi:hypothetical protein
MPDLERWDWEFAMRDATAIVLEATPLQRLHWLDEAVEFVARYAGIASGVVINREGVIVSRER